MEYRPLVILAIVFGAILMALSFALVAKPELADTLGIVSAVVAILAIAVLVIMFIRIRKA
jgi:hypothetical protein